MKISSRRLLINARSSLPGSIAVLPVSEIADSLVLRFWLEKDMPENPGIQLTTLAALGIDDPYDLTPSLISFNDPGTLLEYSQRGTIDFLKWWNSRIYTQIENERSSLQSRLGLTGDNQSEKDVLQTEVSVLEEWLGLITKWFTRNSFAFPATSRSVISPADTEAGGSSEDHAGKTSGSGFTTTGTSFKIFSEDYLTYVKNNFSKGTHENAERVIKFFVEMFGDRDLGSFTLENLEQFKAKRKEMGVSSSTINIDIRTLKAAFQVAEEWKRIPENPFEKAKQLKIDQKTKKILSPDDFKKIIDAIKEKWLRDIVSFNVLTGLRLGEIMNLKWSDYDASRKQIRIQSDQEYRVKGGKMRDVPLGVDAISVLEGRDHEGDYIFLGKGGKKYTNDYVSRKFKEYVREAGLPEEIHFHRLRDTYCTWLADKNVPIHIIKALAGHSSVRVTEGYLSTNTDAARVEVEKIKLPGSGPAGTEEKS